MTTVSIMGDSVSTFEGYNPKGYEVYYDKECQTSNEISSVEDTWWMQVLHAMDAVLCVNNAYSGSVVSDIRFPGAISEERLTALSNGSAQPDYILIYMGYNDQRNSVKLQSSSKSPYVFDGAYRILLSRIMELYPTAKIICGTLLSPMKRNEPGYIFPENERSKTLFEYNETIKDIAKEMGIYLADLAENDVKFESLEGLHPTRAGHKTIADEWIRCLKELGLVNIDNKE